MTPTFDAERGSRTPTFLPEHGFPLAATASLNIQGKEVLRASILSAEAKQMRERLTEAHARLKVAPGEQLTIDGTEAETLATAA